MRYADDMVFGIPAGKDSKGTIDRLLTNVKSRLKRDFSLKEIAKEKAVVSAQSSWSDDRP